MTTVTRDSLLFALAVELYARHHPGPDDACGRCGTAGCAVREHAVRVMTAAGVDSALYDPPPRRPDATWWARVPTTSLPIYRRDR